MRCHRGLLHKSHEVMGRISIVDAKAHGAEGNLSLMFFNDAKEGRGQNSLDYRLG